MRAKMLDSGSANCVAILSSNHKGCQLYDARWLKAMKLQMRNYIGEDLIRLFRNGRWGRSIGSNPDLAG